MNRRDFFKKAGLSSVAATLPVGYNLFAAPQEYNGKLLLTIQATGGWDVTSFCDPKTNVPGELDINNWANAGEIQEVGNLIYAPFADNAAFFQKYYQDMLVINGLDAQTNSHTAGVVHNWSGRISDGFPSITALFAAQNGADLPLSYISNGGFANTGKLVRYTQLNRMDLLLNSIYPNRSVWQDNANWVPPQDFQFVEQARTQREALLHAQQNLTARQVLNRSNYSSALDNSIVLTDFATNIRNADNIEQVTQVDNMFSSLRRQAQIALLAMQSGVSVSADLVEFGFDTHDNHDAQHSTLYTFLTQGIDYIWTYAEQLGLADRLVVVIGSDFGRTPHYNDTQGKDHWPVGSMIVMERNQSYTNRTIGLTDEGHNVIPIDPTTHQAVDNGSIIHPIHVMSELREHLQVAQIAADNGFTLTPAERFGFFS